MPSDAIKCPQCRADIPLSEAVSQQIRGQLQHEFEAERQKAEQQLAERHRQLTEQRQILQAKGLELEAEVNRQVCEARKKLEQEVMGRVQAELNVEMVDLRAKLAEKERRVAEAQQIELALRQKQRELQEKQQDLELEVTRRLEQATAKVQEEAAAKAKQDWSLQFRDLQTQLAERDRKVAEAQQAELELRKQQRELEAKQQALELEVARQLDLERTRIRDEVKRTALEEQRLRLGEKEKVISDLQKQIETLRQKAEQGSQQLQGEVLELEFQQLLQSHFPADAITPVSTGVRGADLMQRVRDGAGQDCGSLIWEAKRTRAWNNGWPAKLKEDQRAHCADVAVLLTAALPAEVKNFASVDGVWVTDFGCALGLAAALRQGLISVANARRVESGKQEKMDVLYRYLSGNEFRQKVEAIVEAFVSMKSDLEAEKRALTRIWAKREKQIEQALGNTALMYGGVQGIIGQGALPAIQLLELEDQSGTP